MTEASPTARPEWRRLQLGALGAGVLCLGLCALGILLDREQAFRSYLVPFLFCLGISLGSLALVMVHNLTGGNWGWAVRGVFEAASCNLWVMAILFVPLLLGLHEIYPWSNWPHEEIQHSRVLHNKSLYLNEPFFLVRAAVYFVLWIGYALLLRQLTRRIGEPDFARAGTLSALSAPGLILYGLTVTLATVDWVMSLEPMWYSSIFGLLFVAGEALSAMAFAVVALGFFIPPEELDHWVSPGQRRDLGSLLLTLVMLWAYMAFSQYLLIWSGDLKEEIPYYLKRTVDGWRFLALLLILLHFALPFILLLNRNIKRNARTLGAVAVLLMVMRLVDLYWMVTPAFHAYEGFTLHWLDVTALVGVGGVWLAAFLFHLGQRPLFARLPAEETAHG